MTSEEFTNLFQTNKTFIYNYCHKLVYNKEDAEDIMHEVFINLWNHKISINTNTALNYLITSARNKCYDFGRRKILTDKILTRYAQEDTFSPFSDGARLSSEEIYLLVDSLFPGQKQLLKMRYIEGYELSEIYKILGKPESTVRNQIFAGISSIRKKLKNQGFRFG